MTGGRVLQATLALALVRFSERRFANTAALMCALDLLITVDSAPAHLAGALGRPVWNLVPFMPDWRWRGGLRFVSCQKLVRSVAASRNP